MTLSFIVNHRIGRIFSKVNRDLFSVVILMLIASAALCYGIIQFYGAEREKVITALGGGLGIFGVALAYCYKEANRRVATVDLFIGVIHSQVSSLLRALDQCAVKENGRIVGLTNTQEIKNTIECLDSAAFTESIDRLDDLLRMPIRYVSAYFSEVNIQAGLIKKIGQVDGADTQLLALPLYCLIKRGVRAIENLADYGEEKIFSKYEKRLLLILDDLSLFILRRDDLSFYLQGGIKFTENEVPAPSERVLIRKT